MFFWCFRKKRRYGLLLLKPNLEPQLLGGQWGLEPLCDACRSCPARLLNAPLHWSCLVVFHIIANTSQHNTSILTTIASPSLLDWHLSSNFTCHVSPCSSSCCSELTMEPTAIIPHDGVGRQMDSLFRLDSNAQRLAHPSANTSAESIERTMGVGAPLLDSDMHEGRCMRPSDMTGYAIAGTA